MVICAYKEQVQLLAQLSSFEVDMSYKRVRSKDINEVLFATFVPDQCKSKCLLSTLGLVFNLLVISYHFIACLY
jgi:hypothetical protein